MWLLTHKSTSNTLGDLAHTAIERWPFETSDGITFHLVNGDTGECTDAKPCTGFVGKNTEGHRDGKIYNFETRLIVGPVMDM